MKLTNTMKDRIISNIMTDTFDLREKAVAAMKTDLADRIYESYYGGVYLGKMRQLPEEFFQSSSSLNIVLGTIGVSLQMSTTRLFGEHHSAWRNWKFESDSPFTKAYHAISRKEDKLNDDKSEMKRTLKSVILPTTTDKRLAEVWPDAEKWIPRTPAAMSNLPAVRPEDLNAMISQMKDNEE